TPLYDGKSVHEVVQLFMKENFDKRDYDIVKEYWQKQDIKPAGPAAIAPLTSETKQAAPAAPAANKEAPKTEAKVSTASNTAANKQAPKPAATPAAATPAAATPIAAPGAPAGKNFEDHWRKAVHDGLIPHSASMPKTVTANPAFLSQPAPPKA